MQLRGSKKEEDETRLNSISARSVENMRKASVLLMGKYAIGARAKTTLQLVISKVI